jgi:hypothetical protein
MVNHLIASVALIVLLGALTLRIGRDRRAHACVWCRAAMGAGLIPLGLQIAVLGLFGFGEMASGDLSGSGHLVPLAVSLLLGVLAWLRPIEGGLALLAVGATTHPLYNDATARWILASPPLISGALLLLAGVAVRGVGGRKRQAS